MPPAPVEPPIGGVVGGFTDDPPLPPEFGAGNGGIGVAGREDEDANEQRV
jgi:hypothetical protein